MNSEFSDTDPEQPLIDPSVARICSELTTGISNRSMAESCGLIGKALGVQHIGIWNPARELDIDFLELIHLWNDPAIKSVAGKAQRIRLSDYTMISRRYAANEPVVIPDIERGISSSAAAERLFVESNGGRGLAIFPLPESSEPTGFISYITVGPIELSETTLAGFRKASETLSVVLNNPGE